MITIGIRELRQRASEYIALVKRGRTVRVTERGRPVAMLVPMPQGDAIERLEAGGRLAPARGSWQDLGRPLEPTPGAPLPSERLASMRDDER